MSFVLTAALLTTPTVAADCPVCEAEWFPSLVEHQTNPPDKPVIEHLHPTRTYSIPVEGWRSLVANYWPPDLVDKALRVIECESNGDPNATNSSSGAAGLFQHLPKYWKERSVKAGWSGASIYDPAANVAVAAWLQRTGGWAHWPGCGR